MSTASATTRSGSPSADALGALCHDGAAGGPKPRDAFGATAPSEPRRAIQSAARLLLGVLIAAAALAAPTGLYGAPLPPWLDDSSPNLGFASSVRVLAADQPILSEPSGSATRRGSAARDVHLPIFGSSRGAGCTRAWIHVGASAWICEDAVESSSARPVDPGRLPQAPTGLLYRYYFVGADGSSAYRNIESADIGVPEMSLQSGFAVAIEAERALEGTRYGRTPKGLWVPLRDLRPARPSAFHGENLDRASEGDIPVAWVFTERARLLASPSKTARTLETKVRFDALTVFDEVQKNREIFLRVGSEAWVSEKDVRRPHRSAPPSEVDVPRGERWIDVDLSTQTLVAYEGSRPVFATLVSTGKGKPGTAMGTPLGTFRIWIKLLTSDMDNLEDERAYHNYRMENVPFVQYFSKGVGLHAAYWHHSFGQVRSHGCVNLAPLDAQHLFWWTGPRLPAGWTAAAPTTQDQGTVIRIRQS